MENVETLLDTPLSKRAKRLDDVAADSSLAPELEESAVADELVYLHLVMAAPGSKKTLTPTPGAGTYVDTKALAVAVHQRLNELTAGYPIVSGASTAAAVPNPNFLFSDFDGDLEMLEETAVGYNSVSSRWVLQDVDPTDLAPLAASHDTIHDLLCEFLAARAYPGSHWSRGVRATPENLPIIEALATLQKVEKNEARDSWFLTAAGVADMRTSLKLDMPSRVFEVRDNIPLTDCTAYELAMVLGRQGWQWRLWVAPSQRSVAMDPIPLGYFPGAQRDWFSGATLNRNYMMALLSSQEQV